MRFRVSLTLLAGAFLAGLTCDDAAPTVTLADQVARAFCAHQFKCCAPFEISVVATDRYRTEEECVPFAEVSARQQLAAIAGAMDLGRITVDPARADACLRAWRDRACNLSVEAPEDIGPLPNISALLAFCPDLLVGHVPPDRACTIAQECAAGSHCVNGLPGNTGAAGGFGGPVPETQGGLGACVRYQKAGERCNLSSDCDPAAHLTCHKPGFVCGPAAQIGEACLSEYNVFTGEVSSNCDTSRKLYCEDSQTFLCRRPPLAGEPCDLRFPRCDPAPELALSCPEFSGICRSPGNEGDACGGAALAPCREDLSCRIEQRDIGVCGPLPRLGEACTDRCASPDVCSSGLCTAPGPLAVGAACITNGDCASLACGSPFFGGAQFCSAPMFFPRCVGSAVTTGVVQTGQGGFGGFGGGMAGVGGAVGGRGPVGRGGTTGTGGAGGGIMPPLGCQFSNLAPEAPTIADFDKADVDGLLPIGGIFTYGSPGGGGPTATIENGALHVTATTVGMMDFQFWGAGIYFNGDPSGTACIDATAFIGVMFDVSGTITGMGCSAQYSTNDSAHSDNVFDPKGSGPAGSFAPQANFIVSPTVTTLMMPFNGAGAPIGGNPPIPIDRARLTGVQWQFTTASGPANSCSVDITIDNVRFF
jgi:hypothetical protein